MKNSNLFINLSAMIVALQLALMINLSAQNELIGYTFLVDFGGHSYYLSNCEATWEEANDAATEMGGYLATFTEGYEIYTLLGPWGAFSYNVQLYNGGELTGLWFGLRGENGIYEWANGEPSNPSSWIIAEPIYTDGAALIRPDYEDAMGFLTSNPVSGETEYIVEFNQQPNCSNNPNKTYVCHNGNTICVNTSALQSHLNHGDLEGPCGPCNTFAMQTIPDDESEIAGQSIQSVNIVLPQSNVENDVAQEITTSQQIQIFPNPASEKIRLILPGIVQEGIVRILSLAGQEIQAIPLSNQQSITLDLSTLAAGIYLIDVRSSTGHYQKKFVKL